MLKIEPQGGRVILEPMEDLETKSSGGVLLDSSSVPKGVVGRIVSVGPSCSQASSWELAVYGSDSGYDMYIDGKLYRVINEYEIIYFKNSPNERKAEDRLFGSEAAIHG